MSGDLVAYTAHYQIGTYSGTIEVTLGEDAEWEDIIAKARKVLRQRAGAPLPGGIECWNLRGEGSDKNPRA